MNIKKIRITESELIKLVKRIVENSNGSKEKGKKQYVVFVSGDVTAVTHEGQVDIFKKGFGTDFTIKDFRYKPFSTVNTFISENKDSIVAVILYSAAAGFANQITSISTSKIYCIEPYNNPQKDRKTRFAEIPASNMYIDNQSYQRGKGLKQGANFTNHDAGHYKALETSANSIRNKLHIY